MTVLYDWEVEWDWPDGERDVDWFPETRDAADFGETHSPYRIRLRRREGDEVKYATFRGWDGVWLDPVYYDEVGGNVPLTYRANARAVWDLYIAPE